MKYSAWRLRLHRRIIAFIVVMLGPLVLYSVRGVDGVDDGREPQVVLSCTDRSAQPWWQAAPFEIRAIGEPSAADQPLCKASQMPWRLRVALGYRLPIHHHYVDRVVLEQLPGIGPTLAGRMMERLNGDRLTRWQQLREIRGIGPQRSRQLAPILAF